MADRRTEADELVGGEQAGCLCLRPFRLAGGVGALQASGLGARTDDPKERGEVARLIVGHLLQTNAQSQGCHDGEPIGAPRLEANLISSAGRAPTRTRERTF